MANKYEVDQIRAIELWKKEEPTVIGKALGVAIEPLAWLVRKVVPLKAMMAALDFANSAGEWMTDHKDIMRDGGVSQLSMLQSKDIKLSDKLADEVHNWAIGFAAVLGTADGYGGILTAPIGVPVLITHALRTVHKIGLCYGYECKSELDRHFVLGILGASGANSIEEKLSALTVLKSLDVMLTKMTWKKMTEAALKDRLSKEAALISIRALAKQLGVNITKRRALAAIPFIGALVGGSVNGWYLKDVGWAARRAFQERWLRENGHWKDDVYSE